MADTDKYISQITPLNSQTTYKIKDANAIHNQLGTVAGDMLYWSASETPARLGAGSYGNLLQISSIGLPEWHRKKVYYGTCTTAAATAIKEVACDEYTTLTKGDILVVAFSVTNSAAVANLQLKVNTTDAKPLKYMYNKSASNLPGVDYLAAQIYICHYDGTNWVIDNLHYNSNTTYSVISVADAIAGTATTGRLITAQRINQLFFKLGGTGLTLTKNSTNGLVLNHDDSGATAGSYGNSSDQTPAYGETFKVPYLTVDAQGHITDISEHNVTIPASDDTTYTISTGDANGQIKITPSNGTAYNVDVRGLGSNAYNSTAYLPLAGGTMTGALNFSGTDSRALTWNDGNWHQRIQTVDDSTADTNVFVFQQSSDSGSSWTDLMAIKDNGKVVANTFIGNGSALTNLNASNLTSGTITFSRLPSVYWANMEATSSVQYDKEPVVKTVTVGNGSGAIAPTKSVQLVYDSTLEVLNFVFS